MPIGSYRILLSCLPTKGFVSPFLTFDEETDVARIKLSSSSDETFDLKFDDSRTLLEPGHLDKIMHEKLNLFRNMSEIFVLFYGHQRASKWDLCRRAASHYIAFLATTYL